MNNKYVANTTAQRVHKRKLFAKISKIVFLLLLAFVSIGYFLLYIVYAKGKFIISLDDNMFNRNNIYLSADSGALSKQTELAAESPDYMDNISVNWISKNIDVEADGSHNGTNYIAYTFYAVNAGQESVNYWYEMDIDDSIKNVDKAIRVMVYLNGEKTVYAKANEVTGEAEEGTKVFFSDKIAILEQRDNFTPGTKDRFTVVVWIEGDDPDCKNDLLGGEIKLHMDLKEEHLN